MMIHKIVMALSDMKCKLTNIKWQFLDVVSYIKSVFLGGKIICGKHLII
jgi:hypothetical protein